MVQVRSFVLSGIVPVPVVIHASAEGQDLQLVCPGADEKFIKDMVGNLRAALRGVLPDPYAIPVRLVVETAGPAKQVSRLALVVAVLAALGRAPVLPHAVLGDVDFQGRTHPMRGTFQALRALTSGEYAIIAAGNAPEASFSAMAGGPFVKCAAVRTVDALAKVLEGAALGACNASTAFNVVPETWKPHAGAPAPELAPWQARLVRDTMGSEAALWVIGIAHPSASLARLVADSLPQLTEVEAAELTAIQSASGQLHVAGSTGVVTRRPFRAPHHTVSAAGLIGGSDPVRPGEVTLAHGGVLYLDEIAEFRLTDISSLRQAMRDGVAIFSRRGEHIVFPARPRVVIARTMPCPCQELRCSCSSERIQRYNDRTKKVLDVAGLAGKAKLQATVTPSA